MGVPQFLMIGASAVQGVMQASHARAQAEATAEAQRQNIEFQQKESHEQGRDADRQAREARSDRVRQTNQQIAQAQTMSGERGLSGTTRSALVRHIGMIEGSDMGRIEGTRQAQRQGAHSQVRAQVVEGRARTTQAKNEARAASTNAFFNTVGTGLRILGQHRAQQESLNP